MEVMEVNVKIDKRYLENILNIIKELTSETCISFGNNIEFLFYSDDISQIPNKILLDYISYDHNIEENTEKIIINPHVLYDKISKPNKCKYVTLSVKFEKSNVNTKQTLFMGFQKK